MKLAAIIFALVLPSCETVRTVTLSDLKGSQPITFTTGKDVKTTLKNAALPVLAWYLSQRPAASGK